MDETLLRAPYPVAGQSDPSNVASPMEVEEDYVTDWRKIRSVSIARYGKRTVKQKWFVLMIPELVSAGENRRRLETLRSRAKTDRLHHKYLDHSSTGNNGQSK